MPQCLPAMQVYLCFICVRVSCHLPLLLKITALELDVNLFVKSQQ